MARTKANRTRRAAPCMAASGVVKPSPKHKSALHRMKFPRASLADVHRRNEYLCQGYREQPGRIPTPFAIAEKELKRQSAVTKFAAGVVEHYARTEGIFEDAERNLMRRKLEEHFWDHEDPWEIIDDDRVPDDTWTEARDLALQVRQEVDHAIENLNKVIDGVMRDSKWLVFVRGLHCREAKDIVLYRLKTFAASWYSVEWLAKDDNCYDLYLALVSRRDTEERRYRDKNGNISDEDWFGSENCHALDYISRRLLLVQYGSGSLPKETLISQLRLQLNVSKFEAPSLEILLPLAAHKFEIDIEEFQSEYEYSDSDFDFSDSEF